jgi:alpha-tubulin suppressor-like RCC1 family protein
MLEISAGAMAACSRGGDGKVHCWGNGQLGRGSQARQRQAAAPVKEGDEPMSGAKQISIGDTMGCAVLDTGALRCWGLGTLGDGSAPPRPYTQAVAVQLGASARPGDVVGPVENANKVALGRQFACYLNLEGEVFCWGQNDYGQLGISGDQVSGMGSCRSAQGSIHCSNHAVSLGIDGVSDLALGAAHACAIVDGGIVCWGSNESLQVRNDNSNEILQPTRLSGIEGAEALALGMSHSCARLSNSKIACWGANQHGQLGQTNLDAQDEIIGRVTGPRNVELAQQRFVASGQHTACSLGPNGTLFCWGKMFVGNDQTGNARLITRLPR